MACRYEGNSLDMWYAERWAKGWTYQQPTWEALEDETHIDTIVSA
jgi:hypothetical protein